MNIFKKAIVGTFILLLIGSLVVTSVWANSNVSQAESNSPVIKDFVASTSYRTGDLLCYAYTYYDKGQEPSHMMINGPIDYNPFVQDGKYKLGIYEWLFIERNTFQSAIWSEHEHKYYYLSLHSNYVKNLIESEGFREAIRACAIAKNRNFETLFGNITHDIVYADVQATVFGRFIQALAIGRVAGFVIKGFMKAVGFLGRITKLGRLRVTATGAVMGVALFQKEDSAYYQIWQSNQELIREARSTQKAISGMVDGMSSISEERALWIRRWQQYDRLISNVSSASTAEAQTVLINLYFIDYWMVQRRLDQLRDIRLESGESETLEEAKLNMVFEMFDFRRRQMERSLAGPSKTKADIVASHLLRMAEDNENFRCNFQDTGDSLCRLHLLYLTLSRNNLTTQEQRQQLQRIERRFSNQLAL